MIKKSHILYLFCTLVVVSWCCKEPYDLPVVLKNTNFLVVEGLITPDTTTIALSRTRNLGDTTSLIPELNATVLIQAERGGFYTLQRRNDGIYSIGALPLNLTDRYRVKILSSNFEYQSEYVSIKQTPPIDSITWTYDHDISIYVSTHDPSNSTRYYRWEYEEVWEYRAFYESILGYANGQLYFRDSTQSLYTCWNKLVSNDIILGSSASLGEDRIEKVFLTGIPNGLEKVSQLYSILVKQTGLTKEAYEFWQLLRKNTKNLGTLFDAQPSELLGNIQNVTNPNEPVIGYVSAAVTQQKRLFIRRGQLNGWFDKIPFSCPVKTFPNVPDSVQFYLSDTTLAPAYSTSGGGLAISKNVCVDCRRRGGTTTKPSFWP